MIKKLLPHICLVLTLLMLVLLVLDQFNPWIMSTDFYSIIMYAFFAIVLITIGLLIKLQRRE